MLLEIITAEIETGEVIASTVHDFNLNTDYGRNKIHSHLEVYLRSLQREHRSAITFQVCEKSLVSELELPF